MARPFVENTLFYGDNLPILREYVADESVDLIYLDPPFNSNRTYNVLFRQEGGEEAEAQIAAFEDTWHWNRAAEETYHELVTHAPAHVGQMIGALREFIGENQMMAYLVMMAARLVELHRVLRPTGSLYLHCDPTASHYLKIVLDTIFGPQNYRSEIIWKRTHAHSSAKRYGPIHDVIFFYTKTDAYTWMNLRQPYEKEYVDRYFKFDDKDDRGRYWTGDLTGAGTRRGATGTPWKGFDPNTIGRHWAYLPEDLDRLDADRRIYWPKKQGAWPKLKRYLNEAQGVPLQDLITDIYSLATMGGDKDERLGYPTQKPLALLERIISASSNPGDVVLDPFCGCGTAVAAAQKLGRRWIGIDITHLSIALQKYRLKEMFPEAQFRVVGEPQDLGGARQLAADDRFQFQWWALSLVRARPFGGEAGGKAGKKGADRGVDGLITFIDDAGGKPKRVIVQVKSGKVGSRDVRDLVGTLEREKAACGVFLTLEPPTRDMEKEAASAGFYHSPGWNRDYPRVQILTVRELLDGTRRPELPPAEFVTFKAAGRVKDTEGPEQASLFGEDAT